MNSIVISSRRCTVVTIGVFSRRASNEHKESSVSLSKPMQGNCSYPNTMLSISFFTIDKSGFVMH